MQINKNCLLKAKLFLVSNMMLVYQSRLGENGKGLFHL